MSKYVKNLITDHLRKQLAGVDDALLVNVIGLTANNSARLRAELRKKNIQLMVVKNSLARRAVEGTRLAPLFDKAEGSSAICWGAEDIVSLAKEITRLVSDPTFAPFTAKAGVMDGQRISESEIAEVSKWPSRAEQLSMLVGQILGPGGRLVSQLTAVGGALASQIEQISKPAGGEDAPADGAAA